MSDLRLHPGRPATARSWLACAFPERPLDEFFHFDPRCRHCVTKLEAGIENNAEVLLARGLDYWRTEAEMARCFYLG